IKGNDFQTCPSPMAAHSGNGEDVAFIDIEEKEGISTCGVYNKKLNLAVSMEFPKKQLPWLVNWQHWGKNEYVTALEPATNPPIGQKRAREEGSLIFLEPGETKNYSLKVEVLANEKIENFIRSF
ncbi:MAG: DUF4432 family protein, partial [Pricia sp.]|nr:DUF4432 family protein [Pricia sp.]